MKMSEEEKEEMTDWLIAREECVEESSKEEILKKENKELREKAKELEIDLTTVYIKGVEDGKEKYKQKIKDKIEELKDKAKGIAGTYQYADSQEHLQEKKNKVIELRTKAMALEELLKEEDK